jgi:acylphosphatase
MPEGNAIRHVMIRGRVQGVGYRAWVAGAAREQGLTGWVRNTSDGSVEAVFAGPLEAVERMISDCRRGPPLARVDSTDDKPATTDSLTLRPHGEKFAILPTR